MPCTNMSTKDGTLTTTQEHYNYVRNATNQPGDAKTILSGQMKENHCVKAAQEMMKMAEYTVFGHKDCLIGIRR